MYLGKQCLMQSAVSKSLAMVVEGSGRKRTVNTSRNCKAIEKRVQRNSRVSMRQSRALGGVRTPRHPPCVRHCVPPIYWRINALTAGHVRFCV
ncbi:hypothetical protein TNCV_2326781 [Trichonephila clavipes]|nr:hypothetical protein TNCV_2326781 [Trichonephila clavipes]